MRINGGFFVCRRELLDYIEPGDELVEETFARLIQGGELLAIAYDGFFGPMDTIKDRQRLEALHERESLPGARPAAEPEPRRPDALLSLLGARTAAVACWPSAHAGRHRDRLRRDPARADASAARGRGHLGRARR